MAKIIINPDNISFNADIGQSILEAALQQHLNLPHGCKNGACGACKCKVISGDIILDKQKQLTLSEDEKNQGYTLLCKAHANTDVELYIPNLLNSFPVKVLPAKVMSIVKTGSIAILKCKTPPNQKFGFFAGQYIEIILNGKNRSYSLANYSENGAEVEIHVKYHKGGVFSEYVWNDLITNTVLRFKGPLGNFKLQDSTKPIILVCTGTGFAPIKSILESISQLKINRQISLYWGNRFQEDFYLLDQLEIWKKELNINIKLCLSREKHDEFISGYVTNCIENDFENLNEYEMYACGNLKMIEDVYELCTLKLNLKKECFFSDAFIPSA